MDVFIDCEWFINQDIFLFGAKVGLRGKVIQLYDKSLKRSSVKSILDEALISGGNVFVFGPDAAMIEKNFNIPVKENYRVINTYKMARRLEPDDCMKVACLEEREGIERDTMKYKSNIFRIFKDWQDPILKKYVLRYNAQDVESLAVITKALRDRNNVSNKDLEEYRLRAD